MGELGLRRALLLLVVSATVVAACQQTTAATPAPSDPSSVCPMLAADIDQLSASPPTSTAPRTILAYVVDRALVPGWDSYPPWPILPHNAFTLSADIAERFPFQPGDVVVGFYKSSRSSAQGEIFLQDSLKPLPAPTLDPLPTIPPAARETNPIVPSSGPSAAPTPAYCGVLANWIATQKAKLARYAEDQRAALTKFRQSQTQALLRERDRIDQGERQPDRTGDDLAGVLSTLDGLANANVDAHVKALLFTDLTDTAQTGVQPRLRRVDAIVALYRRADPKDEQDHMRLWRTRMCGWGAASVSFVKWAATTSDLLLDVLTGKRQVEGAPC